MVRSLIAVLAVAFSISIATMAPAAEEGWTGRYVYEADYGRTAGGTPVIVRYTIVFDAKTPGRATLSADGFQTDETLFCDVKADGRVATLSFRGHEDGRLTNAYGVSVFRPGEALIRLERRGSADASSLVTHWLAYRGLDDRRPPAGNYFRKER